ncbi:hypothetical protein [Haloarcula montana]|uniref:hypothetical protein n=1 Tax=Haloarcula montana TaxID=3111776 RepID=UPI002D782693|nr:hypothetical protein [Haloarcula sp. GH36]
MSRTALTIAGLALAARCIAIWLTLFGINPYLESDAKAFTAAATNAAEAVRTGNPSNVITMIGRGNAITTVTNVEPIWGTMLSPLWLVPGPSEIYASLLVAVIGALAVYNLVVIGRHIYSTQAGIVAAVPVAFFPTFVMVHATVLREAIILCAVTSMVRLWVAPPSNIRPSIRFITGVAFLSVALVLRIENVPLFAVVIAVALVGTLFKRKVVYGFATGITGTLGGGMLLLLMRETIVQYLSKLRIKRTRGRTVYLQDIIPTNGLEMIAFSWIGAVYFLFAPFPWMVETPADIVGVVEGTITLGFAVVSLWGSRAVWRSYPMLTITLLTAVSLGAVLYGAANGNYGTAIRQRQMFTWILFLFGGVGISEHVTFSLDYWR